MRRHWSSLSPARETTRLGVHNCPDLGEILAGGAPEPGEAVRRHRLNPPTPVLVALGEPGLEDLFDSAPGPRPEAGRNHCGRAWGKSMTTVT